MIACRILGYVRGHVGCCCTLCLYYGGLRFHRKHAILGTSLHKFNPRYNIAGFECLRLDTHSYLVTRFMLFAKLVSCRHFPSSDLWAAQTLGVLRRMDRENFG